MQEKIKVLDIQPEYLPDGDCLTSIIYKVFRYHNKPNYEIMFVGQGKLEYTPAADVHVSFNTNKLLQMPSRNYMKELSTHANVDFLKVNDIPDIKDSIDRNQPIMYLGSAYAMPWRRKYGADENEKHGCLIIGYDDTCGHYICIDPVFERGILHLPYENIVDTNIKPLIGYFDFTNYDNTVTYNLSDLPNYFKSDKFPGEYSFDSLKKLASDITKKNEIGLLFLENHYNYLFDSNSSFFIKGRAANIRAFFTFLHRLFGYPWLYEISELFLSELIILRTACGLILKYSRTGRQNLVLLIINKISECADIENKAVDIIKKYC